VTADYAFAEFIDRCCWRYTKHPAYRRQLENERPHTTPKRRTRKEQT
jgi:hypothetical protein